LAHEVVILPSASVLATQRQQNSIRRSPEKRLVVLADPVFNQDDRRVRVKGRLSSSADNTLEDGTEMAVSTVERAAGDLGIATFERLPISRREAEFITGRLDAGQYLKALDFSASSALARSPELAKYEIVHFATHSLLNNQHPELSGIVLSLVDEQGRPQDGFLRLNEIYNLKLDAQLVVLSACQTALGKEVKGEGLIGLTRGFMYAGSPRVVASLWKVGDSGTAELMSRFYQRMLDEHMRPSAALRAAQISLLREKQWRAPYYWAAFVLQGEWR
jgi:CHAT domain-containing protein